MADSVSTQVIWSSWPRVLQNSVTIDPWNGLEMRKAVLVPTRPSQNWNGQVFEPCLDVTSLSRFNIYEFKFKEKIVLKHAKPKSNVKNNEETVTEKNKTPCY